MVSSFGSNVSRSLLLSVFESRVYIFLGTAGLEVRFFPWHLPGIHIEASTEEAAITAVKRQFQHPSEKAVETFCHLDNISALHC